MGIVVQKYGGTSVSDSERIKNVANIIVKTKENGNNVVAVVSAPAGITDKLINMADEITKTPHERELDMLLSVGEQMSIALLAMTIHDMGYEVISFTGYQVGIVTDTAHNNAKIKFVNGDKIKTELNKGKIVIVAGFQGMTETFDITTLGRGGSDTTGVALAKALGAKEVEIYTDVDGIYTSDPRITKNAQKLPFVTYEEMLELSGAGSKVLHLRSVELAAIENIEIHLRSSFVDHKGTLVKEADEEMEKAAVKCIGYSKNEAKIVMGGLPNEPGIAAKIFEELAKEQVNVDIIVQTGSKNGRNDIAITVPKDSIENSVKTLENLKEKIGWDFIVHDDKVAKIAVIGVGMRTHYGVASRTFKALAEADINIEMISTSEIKISCIIDEDKVEKAVEVLHNTFNLDQGGLRIEEL